MTIIELTKVVIKSHRENPNDRMTYLIEHRSVWVNPSHIAEMMLIENKLDKDGPFITELRFAYGTSNMTSGRTIEVVESPREIIEAIKESQQS